MQRLNYTVSHEVVLPTQVSIDNHEEIVRQGAFAIMRDLPIDHLIEMFNVQREIIRDGSFSKVKLKLSYYVQTRPTPSTRKQID